MDRRGRSWVTQAINDVVRPDMLRHVLVWRVSLWRVMVWHGIH